MQRQSKATYAIILRALNIYEINEQNYTLIYDDKPGIVSKLHRPLTQTEQQTMTTDNLGGVQIHSSENAGKSFVIFASQLFTLAVTGTLRRADVPYKILQGFYKGEHETSYLISAEHFDEVDNAAILGRQESVLVLGPIERVRFKISPDGLTNDGARPATLHFLDGSLPVNLGYFVPCAKEDAEKADGFTLDNSTGQYYLCRHIGGSPL